MKTKAREQDLHPSEAQVTAFEETEEERRSFLDRLRRRERPTRLTVEELGGPEPLPLIGGRFAGPDLSLSAWLGKDREMLPGHEPGAVERARRNTNRKSPDGVQKSPFAKGPVEEPVLGIGVQRSPFV